MKINISVRGRGFTMIEILVAMVVLAIGLLGMAGMTIMVTRGNRGAADMTAGTNICQKKIEELKDLSWDEVGEPENTVDAVMVGGNFAAMVQEGSVQSAMGLNSQGLSQQGFFLQENTVISSPCYGQGGAGSWESANADCVAHVRAAGPYKFARTFVVCKGTDYTETGGTSVPPSGSAPMAGTPVAGVERGDFEPWCRIDPSLNTTRTKHVACLPEDITTTVGSGNMEKKLKAVCAWRDSYGGCHYVPLETTIVNFNN
jgi:prepilin-type N-terminal cleavage/methylation domain-containing protein